jgi:hypothetical protein
MLDGFIDFLNKNPALGIIIIVAALYILMTIYSDSCEREGFESVENNCIDHKDVVFKENYEGRSKMINFRCKLEDKYYYMVNMKVSDCMGAPESPESSEVECGENVLVLMEESELREKLKQYETSLDNSRKLCKAKKKIECESGEKQNCDRDYPECDMRRQFTHDFEVTEFITSKPKIGERRKYIVKGVSDPKFDDGLNSPVKLSKNLYSVNKKLLLCGDSGSDVDDTKLMVVEKINSDKGGIIGGSRAYITVRLMFETAQLGGDDKPMYESDGSPKLKQLYITACRDVKCRSGTNEYVRLCLTANSIDPSIIDFEPVSV